MGQRRLTENAGFETGPLSTSLPKKNTIADPHVPIREESWGHQLCMVLNQGCTLPVGNSQQVLF